MNTLFINIKNNNRLGIKPY